MDSKTETFKDKNLINEINSKLIFFDNFSYDKAKFSTEEIFFGKPVYLHQIRIVKAESNPHPKVISQASITQSSPIFNFEVFVRNLEVVSDTLEKVVSIQTINECGLEDCIFPFYSKLVTNHLILRGTFEKITVCIYGKTCSVEEKIFLIENNRMETSLDKLKEQIKIRASEE